MTYRRIHYFSLFIFRLTFVVFLSVVSPTKNLLSQEVFNNIYDLGNLYNSFNALTQSFNQDFIAGDQAFTLPLTDNNTFVARLDNQGNTIWKKEFNIYTSSSDFVADIVEVGSNIYVLGLVRDSLLGGGFNTYILKLNFHGDSLYSKVFTDSVISAGSKLLYKEYHFYIVQWLASGNSSLDNDIQILKTDTFGNVIDKWLYDTSGFEGAQDFKFTNDGGFILAGQSNNWNVSSDLDFYFLKLDSLGNIEWQQTFGNANEESVRNHNYLALTQDGGYVMCGEEDLPSPLSSQGIVLKVDNSGNQLWRKEIIVGDYTNTKSLREWSDGSIIVTGGFSENDIPVSFPEPRGYLMKLSADGNTTIWQREYSKWDINDEDPAYNGLHTEDYVHGMILSKDGGFVVSGYQIHPVPTRNDGWLIKFDSCGFTVGAEPEALLTIDSVVGAQVYISNLSTEYCVGQLGVSIVNTLTGDTTQLDSLAVYAYSQYTNGQDPTQLVYTLPDTGTYFFSFSIIAGDGADSFSTSVQVSDISTGILANVVNDFEFSIYPNPSKDFVIVSCSPSPEERGLGGEAFLNIYNTTGQLVNSLPLNADVYQHKIDVASLSNGVYLLNFTLDGVSVGNKRLSVVR